MLPNTITIEFDHVIDPDYARWMIALVNFRTIEFCGWTYPAETLCVTKVLSTPTGKTRVTLTYDPQGWNTVTKANGEIVGVPGLHASFMALTKESFDHGYRSQQNPSEAQPVQGG